MPLSRRGGGEKKMPAESQPGGWGAPRDADSQHCLVSVGDGETYTIPVEVAEQRYGVRVERFGLDIVPGAGAGRRRGGRGLVREYRICSDEALLTVAWGRHLYPPWGAAGGRDGSPNSRGGVPGGQPPRPPPRKGAPVPPRPGNRVR